jgi:hypothetical protein
VRQLNARWQFFLGSVKQPLTLLKDHTAKGAPPFGSSYTTEYTCTLSCRGSDNGGTGFVVDLECLDEISF